MAEVPKSRVLDKGLWGMSAPMLVDQAVTYTIPLIDMFFLSRVSDDAAAAVGAIMPLVFVANAWVFIPAFAGASVASQRIGANDYKGGNATIMAYTFFVLGLSIIAALAVNYGGPLVAAAMSLTPSVESFAATYLSIIGWMVALWGCRTIYQTILNIYGEPKWNTVSNIVFFVMNILGDAVAIYGFMGIPPSGVAGVAIASVVAAFASLLLVMLIVHFRLNIRLPMAHAWRNFSQLIKPVLRIAAPSILEPMSFQAYMIALNWIAASVGDLALKAKIYAYNTFLFCLMISIALSMATEAIIAQRVGRKEFDIANQQLWRSLQVALWGTGAMAVAWLVFNQPILALFTSDSAVLAIGFWVFLLSAITEPARTTNIIIGSALRCTGDATFSSLSSIGVIWLFSIPLAYVLAVPVGWGVYGLLVAALVDEITRASIKQWRWRQRKWENYGVALWEARQLARRQKPIP